MLEALRRMLPLEETIVITYENLASLNGTYLGKIISQVKIYGLFTEDALDYYINTVKKILQK